MSGTALQTEGLAQLWQPFITSH